MRRKAAVSSISRWRSAVVEVDDIVTHTGKQLTHQAKARKRQCSRMGISDAARESISERKLYHVFHRKPQGMAAITMHAWPMKIEAVDDKNDHADHL